MRRRGRETGAVTNCEPARLGLGAALIERGLGRGSFRTRGVDFQRDRCQTRLDVGNCAFGRRELAVMGREFLFGAQGGEAPRIDLPPGKEALLGDIEAAFILLAGDLQALFLQGRPASKSACARLRSC